MSNGAALVQQLIVVALLGLATTSSCMMGAVIGLYMSISRRVLAAILAFASGSLISALAIELAYGGARELLAQSFRPSGAWAFISGGFALGAIVYYTASRYLDGIGAAVRNPTRFREYALKQYRRNAKETIQLLSKCELLRHLSQAGTDAAQWAQIAARSLQRLDRREEDRRLREGGGGNGLAIVFGNILDTIPGCLVIGAKFVGLEKISLTLAVGMFLGGIPEAAASAAILRRAGYAPKTILLLWSTVLGTGILAAVASKALIGSSDPLLAIFAEAVAGGAVLALVAHAMIPEALEGGGSLVVLPTVAGFLFALYLALADTIPG